MYVCVHCNKEQKHCRHTSPFTTPKTLHNLPGQRYNFWADFGFDLPEEDVFGPPSNAMSIISRSIYEAFMRPRKFFEPTIEVNWNPTLIIETVEPLPPCPTPQAVRKMRVPVYSWSCGHCQEEGAQEPFTVDHPFKINCCYCGHEYTATQIINDLAYDTDYEWRKV